MSAPNLTNILLVGLHRSRIHAESRLALLPHSSSTKVGVDCTLPGFGKELAYIRVSSSMTLLNHIISLSHYLQIFAFKILSDNVT